MEWCWDHKHKHMWGLSAENVMLSNGSILWHTHVSMTAFSPTLCDLKFGYFGWPEKITQVCNLSRARISKEIWNVFKKKINLFDFCIDANNFCSTWLWSIIQVLCAQLWYSGKGFTGWEFLRKVDQGNWTCGNYQQNGNFWEWLIREI